VGDRDTRSEDLLAFELGYRFFALERFNMEIAVFWNEYEDRSSFKAIAPPPPPVVNVAFANNSELTVRGVEVEMNILPAPWWRLKLAYSYLHMDEDLGSGPEVVSFGKVKHDNPNHQFNVQSLFELPMDIEFDVSLYYVDGVSGTVPTAQPKNVEQYVRLDLRLGYKPTDWAEIALIGRNLTDRRHYESEDFTLGQSTQVPRSGLVKVTLEF
jgi:iron complex outermembrane receptor protein